MSGELETIEKLNDGRTITVEINGGQKPVTVRKVRFKHLDALGQVWDKEVDFLTLVVDLTEEDIEQLSDEDYDSLMEAAREVNFTRYGGWLKRRLQSAEQMKQAAPETYEKFQREAQEQMLSGNSQNSTSS